MNIIHPSGDTIAKRTRKMNESDIVASVSVGCHKPWSMIHKTEFMKLLLAAGYLRYARDVKEDPWQWFFFGTNHPENNKILLSLIGQFTKTRSKAA